MTASHKCITSTLKIIPLHKALTRPYISESKILPVSNHFHAILSRRYLWQKRKKNNQVNITISTFTNTHRALSFTKCTNVLFQSVPKTQFEIRIKYQNMESNVKYRHFLIEMQCCYLVAPLICSVNKEMFVSHIFT